MTQATKLTAQQIIKREYGDSKNFMTPNVIKYGKITSDIAFELSWGKGFDPGSKMYGVSLAQIHEDGSTERLSQSDSFPSED